MPLSLRLTGLLISTALALTACDTIAGIFRGGMWIGVGLVVFVLVVITFVISRMRR